MAIELDNSFTVPLPLEQAWHVLLDVERIAPCMPGASVTSVEGDEIEGQVKVKLGPLSLTYKGKAKFTDKDQSNRKIAIEATAKEARGAGTASANVQAILTPADAAGSTLVAIHTSLNVAGRPAQFGRSLLPEVSGKLIVQFASNLEAMLSAEGPVAAARYTERALEFLPSYESGFAPAPALPPGPRRALIIATSRYHDVSLRQLRSPVRDAEDFAGLLADPEIGGFTVSMLIDKTESEIRRALAVFLDGRDTDETTLVYLSCHGIQDRRGRLYFAATDTISKYPHASAIRASELMDELDESRARRQVVILDCCFSGSFAEHKGGPSIEQQLAGHSRGREILTASRSFEYSLEGDPVGDQITGSVFTTGLVKSLRNGEADSDKDGRITVEDAYKSAFRYVRESAVQQTPQHWLFGGEGERIILARSTAGRAVTPAKLPTDLAENLESRFPDIRIGAVYALAEWLTDQDDSRRISAIKTLRLVAENDVPRVARVASSQLWKKTQVHPA
jgi:carbon monoxide dehydrogenase subunit G